MVWVAVVHHSATGHTRLLAEAVAEGAASVEGVQVRQHAIVGDDVHGGRWSNDALLDALDEADAIVFGSPTHMGSVSGTMKAFLDGTLHRWYQRSWVDKVAAGFTVSATPSGDKLQALQTISTCALQHGMIWVGQGCSPMNAEGHNRLGYYLGVGAQAKFGGEEVAIEPADRATGVLYGERVARVTKRLAAGGAEA